jgi:protein gp37
MKEPRQFKFCMGANSHIEWTEATWNPVTGCTKISAGCKNCYAERLALRLQAMGNRRYKNGFRVTLHEDVIDLPKTWKTPRRIFVNSMSDLFHPDVPLDFIRRVFDTMSECRQHFVSMIFERCAPRYAFFPASRS